MGLPRKKTYVSVEAYLASEQERPTRREYVDGQIFDMAGASAAHNRIAGNIYLKLTAALAEKKCDAFISDMKVRVSPLIYYYPDVVVTCESLPDNAYACEQPALIFEVLSPSTARIDRYEKLREYQHLIGLIEYAIVSQDEIKIELYRHDNVSEPWQCEIYSEPEQEICFTSVGVKILVSEIYRRVSFDADVNE